MERKTVNARQRLAAARDLVRGPSSEPAKSGPAKRPSGLAVALSGAGVAPAASGFAYILPAEAVLSGVARRRAEIGFSSIVVEGTYQRGEGGPSLQVWEAIKANRAHRVERRDGTNTEVQLTLPG